MSAMLRPVCASWPVADKGSNAPDPTPEGTAPGLEQSAQTENGTGEDTARHGGGDVNAVMLRTGEAAQAVSASPY